MSETDEIAENIWKARSIVDGNGLNVVAPIRSFDDALRVAAHWLPDESKGGTIVNNVADRLYALAKAAGTVRP